MKRFEIRLWITAAVMAACCLTTMWVRAGYRFEVIPLHRNLESLPLEFDEWRGADVPVTDERVFDILNAQESLNRLYQNREGQELSLFISAWLRPETISEAAPHLPKVCYRNAGWTILEEREVRLNTPTGDVPLMALLIERAEERVVAGYWYQSGLTHFTTAREARRIHRDLWGRPRWPATVKVLMQTPARNMEAGLSLIERFAVPLERELTEVIEPAN